MPPMTKECITVSVSSSSRSGVRNISGPYPVSVLWKIERVSVGLDPTITSHNWSLLVFHASDARGERCWYMENCLVILSQKVVSPVEMDGPRIYIIGLGRKAGVRVDDNILSNTARPDRPNSMTSSQDMMVIDDKPRAMCRCCLAERVMEDCKYQNDSYGVLVTFTVFEDIGMYHYLDPHLEQPHHCLSAYLCCMATRYGKVGKAPGIQLFGDAFHRLSIVQT